MYYPQERYYTTEYPPTRHSPTHARTYNKGSEFITTSYPLESEIDSYEAFSHCDDASSVYSSYSRPASDYHRYSTRSFRRDGYTESPTLPNKNAMSVALFIYQEIYCRYLSPGEAIIHDRGPEFANKVSKCLHGSFGVEIRVIATGRPQGNGQAEAMVKNLKQKMMACMSENFEVLPQNWDQSLMYLGLQIIRADPSTAHGTAPGAIMIGRQLVYPCELDKDEIDFEGTTMTMPLVEKLNEIHNVTFGEACEKIEVYQANYKKKYDKKHKVKEFSLKNGDRIQVKRIKTKRSGNYTRSTSRYTPPRSHYSRSSASMHSSLSKKNEIAQLLEKVEQERYGKQVAESQPGRMWDAVGRPRSSLETKSAESLIDEQKKGYKTQINEDGMLVLNDIKREEKQRPRRQRPKNKAYRTAIDQNGNLTLAPKRSRSRYTFRNPGSEYETTVLDPYGRPIPSHLTAPPTGQSPAAAAHANMAAHGSHMERRREFERRMAMHRLHARVSPRPDIVESPNPMAGMIGVNPNHATPPAAQPLRSGSRNTTLYHDGTRPTMEMMKKLEEAVITSKGTNENWRTQLGRKELKKGDPTKSVIASSAESQASSSSGNFSEQSSVDGRSTSQELLTPTGEQIIKLGTGLIIVRGAINEAKQRWVLAQNKKQLSTESKGSILESLTNYEEGQGMSAMMADILKKVRTEYADDFPESVPTHVRFTESDTLMGSHWHAEEDGCDTRTPLMSLCIGNSYSFGYRPIWNNFDTEKLEEMDLLEYKSKSYMSPPDFVDVHSGDVMIWGGVSKYLVHNVERVYPRSSSIVKNKRFEIVFRDCETTTTQEN